ncbi:LysR family transcriptional regulator [Azospirillum griseum]|uniref:LysR family transcriptional regulator n=1 Tax=Azospirillum griseum TaxID=2496639 RepID=A0A431VD96_9PROT|nr:LysR family transcriptional regulator [Azospirillum griseum]
MSSRRDSAGRGRKVGATALSLDWDDINLILVVARSGGFSGGAAVLGLDQSTVSRRIARIETTAGAPLFVRSRSGVIATDFCLELLQLAEEMDQHGKSFHQALWSLRKQPERVILVKASGGLISYFVGPLAAERPIGPLACVRHLHPDITFPPLRPVAESGSECEDIRLRWTEPDVLPSGSPDLRIRRLARVRWAVHHARTPSASSRPNHWDELPEHPLLSHSALVLYPGPSALGPWLDVFARASAQPTVPTEAAQEKLLLSGSVLTPLPTFVTLVNTNIVALPIDQPPMHLDLWIMAEAEALRDKTVRAVFDGLVKLFHAFDWERLKAH